MTSTSKWFGWTRQMSRACLVSACFASFSIMASEAQDAAAPPVQQPSSLPSAHAEPSPLAPDQAIAPGNAPPALAGSPSSPLPAPIEAPPQSGIDQGQPQDNTPPLQSETQPTSETLGGGPKRDTLPHNLSPWSMFLAADIVVKGVMLGLVFASFVTWTVWIAKSFELTLGQRRLHQAAAKLSQAQSLHDASGLLAGIKGPVTGLIEAAAFELRRSEDLDDKSTIKDRVASCLDDAVLSAGRQMNSGTGILATIGSTAPFIGLFGTVWGIMNSFISISESQTTNLAIVAPGIAEALLATAIGLVAAIPAVIIYNVFARSIAAYKARLSAVSAEILRFVSRDLDRMQRRMHVHAAVG